jgi:U3 small nucleolar RNA-associated protein 20
MCKLLGGEYIGYILNEAIHILKHGYQFHVLAYTVYHILNESKKLLFPSCLDISLDGLNDVIFNDIFGMPAEEKSVICATRM